MTIFKQELRQGRAAFAVWTASIALLLAVCVFLFPEMKANMGAVGTLFASMGSFTAAFGMDRLNFGTLIGFYAVECGNICGLGGALFSSLTGISAFEKEMQNKTAEFLFTHPVSKARIVTEKLAAVSAQIAAMNLIVFCISLLSVKLIKEPVPLETLLLLHTAYFLLQLELAGICFGISAFLRRGGLGIGLGLPLLLYFLNLLANMSAKMRFLKYLTPFAYCEGADIIADNRLPFLQVAIGMLFACAGLSAAYIRYRKNAGRGIL